MAPRRLNDWGFMRRKILSLSSVIPELEILFEDSSTDDLDILDTLLPSLRRTSYEIEFMLQKQGCRGPYKFSYILDVQNFEKHYNKKCVS